MPPSEIQHAMRLGVGEGVLSQIHASLTLGTLATGLALLLGARSFELGILAALPVLGSLIQFPAAWWIERYGDRRRLSTLGSLGRLLWLVPAALLFVPLPAPVKLSLFLLASAIGHMMLAGSLNAWIGWMTDLIPARVRGRYFGFRGGMMGGAAMIAGYLGAWLIDRGRAAHVEPQTYAGLLVLAAACGGAGTFLLARQPEPRMLSVSRRSIGEILRMPLRHTRFRAFAGTWIIWQIGMGIAAPFFTAYGLTALHLSLRTLALMDVIASLTSLLAQPRWGRLADRIGQRKVLMICMLGVVPLPWFWIVATPARIWPLFVNATMSGALWAGLTMTQTNRLMEQAPAEGRSAYVAAFSAMTALPYMLASLGVGALMSMVGVMPLTLAGVSFHPYLIFFLFSGLLRLIALIVGRKAL